MTLTRRLAAGCMLVVVIALVVLGFEHLSTSKTQSASLANRPLVQSVPPQPQSSVNPETGQADPQPLTGEKDALRKNVNIFVSAYFSTNREVSQRKLEYAPVVSGRFRALSNASHLAKANAPDRMFAARVIEVVNGELDGQNALVQVRMGTLSADGLEQSWIISLVLKKYRQGWLVDQLPTAPVEDFEGGVAT